MLDKLYIFGGYDNKLKITIVNVDAESGLSNLQPELNPRSDWTIVSRNNSIYILGGSAHGQCLSRCERFDLADNRIVNLPDLPSKRQGSSALDIPDKGVLLVGGCQLANQKFPALRNVEMLVEDGNSESEWKWIHVTPMLEERYRPGIELFNEYLIVAGGNLNFTVECLHHREIGQAEAQWTRLNGLSDSGSKITSLTTFNNKLLLLRKLGHLFT